MAKLKYNRDFRKYMSVIILCLILFGSLVVLFIISRIQYDRLISDMEPLEATIVDIDWDIGRRIDKQEIYIEYEVDGIVYNRELATDTTISFAAGTESNYKIGDKVQIFYNPQDPNIIASPRSISVGLFAFIFALISLVFVLIALFWLIKSRHKFLVTHEEYKKEGEEIKRNENFQKTLKKQAKLASKNGNNKVRK